MRNSFSLNGIAITWLNHHAAFRIDAGDRRIYIDPWEIEPGEKADAVLVSHSHYDHFNTDDIRRVSKAGTLVVVAHDCAGIAGNVKHAVPGQRFAVENIVIETVPAYNVNKFRAPGQPFHPQSERWLGFLISIGDVTIYHAGDTDVIEEMNALPDIDVALLPCGGTYTMDGAEAGAAANLITPRVLVPMHWGKIIGDRADAERAAKAFSGETKILE